jgi:hypothetical protein
VNAAAERSKEGTDTECKPITRGLAVRAKGAFGAA